MRVLIVEDNAFNAFCLRRLLESMSTSLLVTIVNNSQAALSAMQINVPDIVIIDGELGAHDGIHCNGPALADAIFQKFPHVPLIAWSDSIVMREAFSTIFKQYNRPFNEHSSWTKVISLERIRKTWAYHFEGFMGGQSNSFSYHSGLPSNSANAG